MDNVSKPAQLNDRFTVSLSTAGEPVQRTLRQMTHRQLMAAIDWNFSEADRLDRAAAPLRKLSEAIEAEDFTVLDGISKEELQQGIAFAAVGSGAATRLMALVYITIPQSGQHKGTGLGEALRRFWPTSAPRIASNAEPPRKKSLGAGRFRRRHNEIVVSCCTSWRGSSSGMTPLRASPSSNRTDGLTTWTPRRSGAAAGHERHNAPREAGESSRTARGGV
jgi:hypothetical protein